jgi:hypothetical protein
MSKATAGTNLFSVGLSIHTDTWEKLLEAYRRMERTALMNAELMAQLDASRAAIQQSRERLSSLQVRSFLSTEIEAA